MKIVFVGNFGVPFSTESHHKWTWEKLGHEIVALQQNKTTTDEIVRACEGAQLLQWTVTHGWSTPGSFSEQQMLDKVRAMGVKSFSYHLDYYFGLNMNDRRDQMVGQHPSWKVDTFFSTDGGHEDQYRARGVNHIWLPPGVVEYGCFEGTRTKSLEADIGFTGSVGYHPEYPFRAHLIASLRNRYGNRFRLYQGYRERPLNDVYASCKVFVGDHVFAGCPRYWSDRLPETCGRGGFIVYPRTEGVTIPTATYEPQNLVDLFEKIDYYLARDEERERIRKEAHEHVRAHDTYTHRLSEVLRVLGL